MYQQALLLSIDSHEVEHCQFLWQFCQFVAVFGRPERSSSWIDVRPRVKTASHLYTVENEVFILESRFLCPLKSFKRKYFTTALTWILIISHKMSKLCVHSIDTNKHARSWIFAARHLKVNAECKIFIVIWA